MKRAIKYWNIFKSNAADFSSCGTEYEVLPGLYPDDAGIVELRTLAKSLGLKTRGVATLKSPEARLKLSHSVKLVGKHERTYFNKTETFDLYLGFIELPDVSELPAKSTLNNSTPKGLLYELINGGDGYRLGIEEYGESVDGETWLVKTSWRQHHIMPLLGYSLEKFYKAEGIDDVYFEDSVSRCSECGLYNHNDDGYTYNFRATDDGYIGIECGCFEEYALNNYSEYVNEPKKCIELSIAETLKDQGKIEFIERFIGGMVDGRGGCFRGERTREGEPSDVLTSLLEETPNGEFIFTHDESGQFQTYFSVWRVLPKSKKSKGVHNETL